jgi:LacI family transcriptional regulator
MRRRVTIEDIAHHSNTSITTVSMVLRDKPGIGAETRERVLEVARELGYQRRTPGATRQTPRTAAMILRTRADARGAHIPSVNPFYADVIDGLESAARTRRINLLYGTLPVGPANQPYQLPDHLLDQQLDGVLLIGAFAEETIDAIAAGRSGPVVLVDGPAVPSPHDTVASDNEGGASIAVRHLLERGHRHIAMIGTDLDADPNLRQRRAGYLRALAERGLEPRVVQTHRVSPQAISDAAVELLTAHPELTAIVGANDAAAIEAMRGAQRAGRQIPADLSVIGFDDIALASEVRPALTTMAVDRLTMGRQAIRLLEDRLETPGACRIMTVLQPTLTIRDSVGPVPAGTPAPEVVAG